MHQVFVRDRFDGDGGVPLNIIDLPNFKPELASACRRTACWSRTRRRRPCSTATCRRAGSCATRSSSSARAISYFVTEGVYGDPDEQPGLPRTARLPSHPAAGPEPDGSSSAASTGSAATTCCSATSIHRDKYRTEVTAGDDPDCICGYWWLTIAPMDITTMEETQAPLDIETVARTTFVNDRTQAFYGQDQIDIAPAGQGQPRRTARRLQARRRPGGRLAVHAAVARSDALSRTARASSTRRATTSSSTSHVELVHAGQHVPADGSQLDPQHGAQLRSGAPLAGMERPRRHQPAVYYIVRNNVTIQRSVTTFIQVGEQTSKGLDLDVNTDLGGQAHLIFNYGLARPRFEDAEELTGMTPRFVPKHNVNLWLRKDWSAGFNAGFGARYLGEQFADDDNTATLDGYTIFSGAVGYRADRWEWTLNAENLFNNDGYFLPGHFGNNAFPGQPINVTTTIRLKFN